MVLGKVLSWKGEVNSISLFNMIDTIDMENVLKPDKFDVNPNSSDAAKR